MGHAHDHHGHGHHHGIEPDADQRRLAVAFALIASFMVVEVVAGLLSQSLALLSDAAHMLTDAAALAVSLVVVRLVRQPAGGNRTFGLRRTEILSAQANGATLLVLGLLIVYGGIRRLISPPPAAGWAMVVVALAGVVVNLAATSQLARANRRSLNIEGSFQHLLTDLFAFALTAVAGAVILLTGWRRADGVAALVIAALMVRAAIPLLLESGRVLLEIAPPQLDVDEIGRALAADARVAQVHDLHVWELGSDFPSLSAHVLVGADEDCHAVRGTLEELLHERFGIAHTTLQVEHARAELHTIATLRTTQPDR